MIPVDLMNEENDNEIVQDLASMEEEDEQLARALQMSMATTPEGKHNYGLH